MPPTTKPLSLPGPGSLPGPKRQNSLNLHIALCALLLWITCPASTPLAAQNLLLRSHAAPNPPHVTLSRRAGSTPPHHTLCEQRMNNPRAHQIAPHAPLSTQTRRAGFTPPHPPASPGPNSVRPLPGVPPSNAFTVHPASPTPFTNAAISQRGRCHQAFGGAPHQHNLPQPTGRPLNNPLPATHTVAAPNPQHVTLSDSPKALPLGPDLPASHAPAPFKMPPIRPRPQTPSRPHPHLPQAPPTSTPLSSAASCIPQPTLQARLVSLQRSEAPPQSASRAFSISFA
jgi:hypothetical protein